MKTALKIITALFGLFWLVFGLNNFLHFFPIPEPSQAGADFMQALENTGYVLPLVYGALYAAVLFDHKHKFIPLLKP